MKHHFAAAVVVSSLVVGLASAQNYAGLYQHAPDGSAHDHFGAALAIGDSLGAIGAPDDDVGALVDAGSVRILQRNPDLNWALTVQILAPTPQAGARFGTAVAIEHDRLVVSSPGASIDTLHYFRRQGSGAWIHVQSFSGFAPPGEGLGESLAIRGRTLWAGAPKYAAPLTRPFRLQENGLWAQVAPAMSAINGSQFGRSIAVDGPLTITGAPGQPLTTELGAGTVYIQEALDGTSWTFGQWLTANDLHVGDAYGWSSAISGERVLVGAPGADNGTLADTGAVYVHERQANGGWMQVAKLQPADLAAGARFGTAVALRGNVAVVGAPLDTSSGVSGGGTVQLFARRWDGVWERKGVYGCVLPVTGDRYGAAVALFDGGLIGGAPQREKAGQAAAGATMLYRSLAPLPVSYCTSNPNSSGQRATLSWTGSRDVGLSNFELVARGAPPSRLGLFVFGPTQTQTPFGDGVLCVGGLARLSPISGSDAWGKARLTLDMSNPGAAEHAITAGTTWNFQYWFRDPDSSGAGFGGSDALSVQFAP